MTICRSWYGAMSGPGSIVNIFFCPPYARDTKPGLALLGEEPLVLPLLLFVGRVRELIESVRDDQATAGVELASLRSKIVNRPTVLSRPAPPPLHEIAYVRLAVDHPHDRRRVGDGSGANSRRRKASRVVLSRLQAWSTAFHTAGASRPWTPRRPSPNCPLRMRCINSIPAIVIAAVAKPLKPSIVAIRCFTPRWSCSIRLFKYFDDRSFVSAGSKPSPFSLRTAR